LVPLIEEGQYVVDNIRDFAGSMATRAGYFLYAGWIHPHLAGSGDCGRFDPSNPGTANSMIAEVNQ
jgi:hypothetical protein